MSEEEDEVDLDEEEEEADDDDEEEEEEEEEDEEEEVVEKKEVERDALRVAKSVTKILNVSIHLGEVLRGIQNNYPSINTPLGALNLPNKTEKENAGIIYSIKTV